MEPIKVPQPVQTSVITLFGVNPTNVLAKFQGLHYTNIVLPRMGGRQAVVNQNSLFKPSNENGMEDPQFSYTKKNGVEVTFVSTNQDLFEGLEASARSRPLNCGWCRWPLEAQYVGNPIELKVSYDEQRNPIYTFICDGRLAYCDESCGLAHFLSTEGGVERFNIQRHQTEHLIYCMHILRHKPECPPLKPAIDYCLLCSNGGPLTRQQYKDKNSNAYIRDISTVVLKYGKSIYQSCKN